MIWLGLIRARTDKQAWRRFRHNLGGRVPKAHPLFFTFIYKKRVMQAKQAIAGTQDRFKGEEGVLVTIIKRESWVLD